MGVRLMGFDYSLFTRYIRENPARRFVRMSHSEYFRRVNEISFLGRTPPCFVPQARGPKIGPDE